MSKNTVTTIQYTDDIDGGKADSTVSFAYEGISYEIDLSKANTRAFGKAIALYVGHARKVRGARSRSAAGASPKSDLSAVRQWARGAGYEVSERGRVAAAIVEAYQAAN